MSTPLTWEIMRNAARSVLKKSARKIGIDWDAEVEALSSQFPASTREETLSAFTRPNLTYPAYYLKPFHAYQYGHLGWEAAFETAPAAYALARVHLTECGVDLSGMSPAQMFSLSRGREVDLAMQLEPALREIVEKSERVRIVDGACGTGMSTNVLWDYVQRYRGGLHGVEVCALDASPYMLAVASKNLEGKKGEIVHALLCDTCLESGSVDWFNVMHTIHELPVLREFLAEAYRVLRKGGVLTVADTDPSSEAVKKMNQTRLTVMKSTEPHIDVWFTFDFQKEAERIGFTVNSDMSSARHRTYTMRK